MAIEITHGQAVVQGGRGAANPAHPPLQVRGGSVTMVQKAGEMARTVAVLESDDVSVRQRRTEAESESLAQLVERVNERPQIRNRSLQFSVDESTGKMLVKVYNADTKELIRQIPPEELLDLAERLQELLDGTSGSLILQEKA